MDRIVAATSFRDHILVFTERGDIYQVFWDDFRKDVEIRKLGGIILQ